MQKTEIAGSDGACTDVSYTVGGRNMLANMDQEQVILYVDGTKTYSSKGRQQMKI